MSYSDSSIRQVAFQPYSYLTDCIMCSTIFPLLENWHFSHFSYLTDCITCPTIFPILENWHFCHFSLVWLHRLSSDQLWECGMVEWNSENCGMLMRHIMGWSLHTAYTQCYSVITRLARDWNLNWALVSFWAMSRQGKNIGGAKGVRKHQGWAKYQCYRVKYYLWVSRAYRSLKEFNTCGSLASS